MDKRIQHKLNEKYSQRAVNVDTYDKVNLEQSNRPLPVGDINRILDVGEQFNTERQSSTCYRLNGTITNLFNNVLYNSVGPNSKETILTNPNFRDGSYPQNGINPNEVEDTSYRRALSEHVVNIDGWNGYYDPDLTGKTICLFTDMEPNRTLFEFTPKNKIKNWGLTVTYPSYSADTALTQGGLIVVETTEVMVGNRPMVAFTTPVKHGLLQRDTVRLFNLSNPTLDGDYTVVRVGLDNGDLFEYTFVIDIDDTVTISNNTRMKRVVRGQESDYYFRVFEKVPTTTSVVIEDDDYELYPLNFSKSLYNDQNVQFVFNEDIDVGDIRDNLGRPISELYITMVKTDSNQNDGQGTRFTERMSGLELPFIGGISGFPTTVPDIRRIHSGTIPAPHTPLETSIDISMSGFYGDVVAYNKLEIREDILGVVVHRFNTPNRIPLNPIVIDPSGIEPPIDMGQRYEGYFYRPHHKVNIRDFSLYIEQGDLSTGGIPDYAEDLGDGRWLWRDLLDIGFSDRSIEPINYPFLNGCHYIYSNICIPLRRQDPFGEYGLYYSSFPRDSYGITIEDNFTVKRSQDVC